MAGPADTFSELQQPSRASRRRAAHLLLEIECERPLAGPARYCLSGVRQVRFGRGDARAVRLDADGVLDIALADGWMSSRHAELHRGVSGWELVDLRSKNGSLRNGVPIHSGTIEDGDQLRFGHTFFRFCLDLPVVEPAFLDAADLPAGYPGLRTMSPTFAEIAAGAAAIAPSRAPVLVVGESGTGKELMAQAIHALSGRRGLFVAVNCGAMPRDLVESELFGHRKGAFSGAQADRAGWIRQADGGTLFLDEIGDLPLPAQAALLRVLQESQVAPVGADRPVEVDLRVVSATNRNLDAMVREGTFRHDLLARLDGMRIHIPSLGDRREDLPLLISTLLARLAPDRADLKLEPDATQALFDYHWPLNVRELAQSLQAALALSRGRAIACADLPRTISSAAGVPASFEELGEEQTRMRDELVAHLEQHHGNVTAVARAMGRHRTQVQRLLLRYGIAPDKFRPAR